MQPKTLSRLHPMQVGWQVLGDKMTLTNLFTDLPQHLPKELVQTLLQAADNQPFEHNPFG